MAAVAIAVAAVAARRFLRFLDRGLPSSDAGRSSGHGRDDGDTTRGLNDAARRFQGLPQFTAACRTLDRAERLLRPLRSGRGRASNSGASHSLSWVSSPAPVLEIPPDFRCLLYSRSRRRRSSCLPPGPRTYRSTPHRPILIDSRSANPYAANTPYTPRRS